jgi:hypothetical protein
VRCEPEGYVAPLAGRCLSLWAVAQAVEGDPEDVLDLPRVAGGDLGDSDHHLDDLGDVDVRADNARVLGALE